MKALQILPAGLAAWLVGAAAAWAQQAPGYGGGYGYGGHHPHMWGGGWGGMVLGPLFGILFIVVVAIAIVLVVRALGGGRAARGGGRSALDTLDERFARGEIDASEYDERKRVLTEGR